MQVKGKYYMVLNVPSEFPLYVGADGVVTEDPRKALFSDTRTAAEAEKLAFQLRCEGAVPEVTVCRAVFDLA